MMERGIQIKGAEDPDPRAFDTDAVLVSQEEIEEQFAQVMSPDIFSVPSLPLLLFRLIDEIAPENQIPSGIILPRPAVCLFSELLTTPNALLLSLAPPSPTPSRCPPPPCCPRWQS